MTCCVEYLVKKHLESQLVAYTEVLGPQKSYFQNSPLEVKLENQEQIWNHGDLTKYSRVEVEEGMKYKAWKKILRLKPVELLCKLD